MAVKQEKLICNQVKKGIKCGGEIELLPHSNGKDPCKCMKCGRKYPSYAGLRHAKKSEAAQPKNIKPKSKVKPKTAQKDEQRHTAQGQRIKQAKQATDFFSSAQNDAVEAIVLETVYEAAPEAKDYNELEGTWTDAPDGFGRTRKDIEKLLSAEEKRLTVGNFVLSGINFNPMSLPKEAILSEIRAKSINSLMFAGKTYTQVEIDDRRKGEKLRSAAEAEQIGLVRSEQAETCLPYCFYSGYMTKAQSEELESFELLPAKLLKSEPPSSDCLYKAISAEQLSKSLSYKNIRDFSKIIVDEYINVWMSICSDICNKEFGSHSYWIAAGGNWFIGEYASEVIKTAFASALSVTPLVSLEQLRSVYERSHNYLNDLEFIYNSPKNIRDVIEHFSEYSKAYYAVYEGAVTTCKPKPPAPYKFTWRAYVESDVVILTLPSVGLVTGGIAVLVELLNARNIAGLPTIIVSTSSVTELNELNASFLPSLFAKTGISLVSRNDIKQVGNQRSSNFMYFSIYDDTPERKSTVMKKRQRIEARQST